MAQDDTRAIVTALYGAYARQDLETIAAAIHDDIDWVIYSPISVFPFAGPKRGRTAVLQAMAEIGATYALEYYHNEIIVVDGDRAAVMSDVKFSQRATARIMRFRVANFLRFQDGRLIEFREFANSFDIVEQVLGRELEI